MAIFSTFLEYFRHCRTFFDIWLWFSFSGLSSDSPTKSKVNILCASRMVKSGGSPWQVWHGIYCIGCGCRNQTCLWSSCGCLGFPCCSSGVFAIIIVTLLLSSLLIALLVVALVIIIIALVLHATCSSCCSSLFCHCLFLLFLWSLCLLLMLVSLVFGHVFPVAHYVVLAVIFVFHCLKLSVFCYFGRRCYVVGLSHSSFRSVVSFAPLQITKMLNM